MTAMRIVADSGEFNPQRLGEAIKWAGVSTRWLCREIGKHEQFISRCINGQVRSLDEDLLDKIAVALAGKGLLASYDKDQVKAYLLGQLNFRETRQLELAPFDSSPVGPGDGATTQHRDTGTEPTVEPYPHAA